LTRKFIKIFSVPAGNTTVEYTHDANSSVILKLTYPTGYAQVLEELTFNKADPDLSVDTPDSVTSYTIGDDVIAQNVDGAVKYLLYDGQGSTRQLSQ